MYSLKLMAGNRIFNYLIFKIFLMHINTHTVLTYSLKLTGNWIFKLYSHLFVIIFDCFVNVQFHTLPSLSLFITFIIINLSTCILYTLRRTKYRSTVSFDDLWYHTKEFERKLYHTDTRRIDKHLATTLCPRMSTEIID